MKQQSLVVVGETEERESEVELRFPFFSLLSDASLDLVFSSTLELAPKQVRIV